MQRAHFLCGVLAVTALATGLEAQSTDWEALCQVPAGTKIKVKLKHHPTFGHCTLEDVAADHLDCTYSATGTRRFARADIRQVLLARHNARTGLLVGAAAGLALGARGCCDATGKGLSILILAPVLGGIGAAVGAVADPLIDGKAVYRTPDSAPHSQSDQPEVIRFRKPPGPKSSHPEVTMNYPTLCCLLTLALPVGMQAQTESTFQSTAPETVAAARCPYTPGDPACTAVSRDTDALAQARGRMRPMPPRRPMPYPRSYAPIPEFSSRHALIGGIIGFGFGAALGAKGNKDQHPGVGVKAACLVGSVGGLIGAAIGALVPSFQARSLRHRGWPQEPEQDELASNQPDDPTPK